jgi:hypothetical protein
VDFPTSAQATIETTLIFFFAHARSRKVISSSQPNRSVLVTGNLATEIFSGPGLAGGLGVPTRKAAEGAFCSLWRVSVRLESIAPIIVGIALHQFVWSLETLCRIFLKEFLNENYDWLWNIFESLKRKGRVLMLIHHEMIFPMYLESSNL